ncbi:MAG: glycosyltransferase [Caulobacter sp.]
MRIAYFVHNLKDPAVRRRLWLLRLGGAEVSLLGFRRSAEPVAAAPGEQVVNLGRTHDAAMGQRAMAVAKAVALTPRLRAAVAGRDVIMARNMETLAVAVAARALHAPRAKLIYECLDVHRSLLGEGIKSKAMRWMERRLMAACDQVVVSSPAFVEHYFEPRQRLSRPWLLIENKLVHNRNLDEAAAFADGPPPGPPWTIGWFGVIRCAKSLTMLREITAALPGQVKVVIRGQVARHEFDDFDGQIAATPGMTYLGPYDPSEVSRCYGEVHFSWTIDYFEEGLNSAWLLPNRLYEGGRNGVPALALAGVETGRWVSDRNAGLVLGDPVAEVTARLGTMTPAQYAALRGGVEALAPSTFTYDSKDSARLVAALAAQGAAA